jgi:hypothetical protein
MDPSQPQLPHFFFDDFDLEALLLPYIGLSHLNLSTDEALSSLPHLPLQLKSSESLSLPHPEDTQPYDNDSQSPPDAGIHRMGRVQDFAVFDLADLVLHPLSPLLLQLSFFQAIGL